MRIQSATAILVLAVLCTAVKAHDKSSFKNEMVEAQDLGTEAILGQVSDALRKMATQKLTATMQSAVTGQLQTLLGFLPSGLVEFFIKLFQAWFDNGSAAVLSTYFQLKTAMNNPVMATMSADRRQEIEDAMKVCECFSQALDINLNEVNTTPEDVDFMVKSAVAVEGRSSSRKNKRPGKVSLLPPKKTVNRESASTCGKPQGTCVSRCACSPVPSCCNTPWWSCLPGMKYLLSIHSWLSCFCSWDMCKAYSWILLSAFVLDVVLALLAGAALYANFNCSSCGSCGGGAIGLLPDELLPLPILDYIESIGSSVISVVFAPAFLFFAVKAIILFLAIFVFGFGDCAIDGLSDLFGVYFSTRELMSLFDLKFLSKFFLKSSLSEESEDNAASTSPQGEILRSLMSVVDAKLGQVLGVKSEATSSVESADVSASNGAASIGKYLDAFMGKAKQVAGFASKVDGALRFFQGLTPDVSTASSGNLLLGLAKVTGLLGGEGQPKSGFDLAEGLKRLQAMAEVQESKPEDSEYVEKTMMSLKEGGNHFLLMEKERLEKECQQSSADCDASKMMMVDALMQGGQVEIF